MKSIITKAEGKLLGEGPLVFDPVSVLNDLLASTEKQKDSVRICISADLKLYWSGSEWTLHGKMFNEARPDFKRTITKKELTHFLSDMLGLTLARATKVVSNLYKTIDSKLSGRGGKIVKYDFFGKGTLSVGEDVLSFFSVSESVSESPLEYIKGLKLKSGEGFTLSRGSGLKELDANLCGIILNKLRSRTVKKDGGVVGFDVDPFFIPSAVVSISKKVLGGLAKHKGRVDFTAVKTIDEEGAEELANYEGCNFSFVGKGRWPVMERFGFTLGGLTSISDQVSAKLSKFKNAEPPWVKELSLAWPGKFTKLSIIHDFSGLTSISPKALKSLAKLQGHLDLSGLKSFTVEHATALKGHEGGVFLCGLRSISVEAAKELAQIKPGQFHGPYRGSSVASAILKLSGIVNIETDVAEALLGYKGILDFGTVDKLTEDLATIIKEHKQHISISFERYDERAKEILEKRGDFEFD